jgi:hypothetical protein
VPRWRLACGTRRCARQVLCPLTPGCSGCPPCQAAPTWCVHLFCNCCRACTCPPSRHACRWCSHDAPGPRRRCSAMPGSRYTFRHTKGPCEDYAVLPCWHYCFGTPESRETISDPHVALGEERKQPRARATSACSGTNSSWARHKSQSTTHSLDVRLMPCASYTHAHMCLFWQTGRAHMR